VIEGKGGAMSLSDRDKREIASTARKLLNADRQPEAKFTSTKVTGDDQGGVVEGTLTMLGQDHPFTLKVGHPGEKKFTATGTVVQSEYGIKPYTAMFGALKLADPVGIEAEIDLSGSGQ
jgi:polyisoprenoid-binding protein YceI